MPVYGIKLNEKNNPVLAELKVVPVKNKFDVEKSLEEAISQLNHIYQQVPKSSCNRCGSCCDGTKTGNPKIYSIEYLSIMRFLNQPKNKQLKTKMYGTALMGKALLDKKKKEEPNLVENWDCVPTFCPAIDKETKLCWIYEHRPLVCRLYGLGQWYKEKSKSWVKEPGESGCDQVNIDDDDQTEYWPLGNNKILFKQLALLSTYHYLDEVKQEVFKADRMTNWFTLKADNIDSNE
jgi:Fe-S-cluster containining protein